MRLTRMVGLVLALALGLVVAAGCPFFVQLPDGDDNGPVDDDGNNNGGPGDDNGSGGDGGNNQGGDPEQTKVVVSPPAQHIGLDLVGIHDPDSSQYNADCIGCHGDRTNEVALDGVTPAAHSTMVGPIAFADTPVLVSFGEGNARCIACHSNRVDFLSFSAGKLREPVNTEYCGHCHSTGNLKFYQRPN